MAGIIEGFSLYYFPKDIPSWGKNVESGDELSGNFFDEENYVTFP